MAPRGPCDPWRQSFLAGALAGFESEDDDEDDPDVLEPPDAESPFVSLLLSLFVEADDSTLPLFFA